MTRRTVRLVLTLLLLLTASPFLSALPWQGFTALTISADGRWFATGGREGEVLWFETATGELRARWVLASAKPVVAVIFDRDATHLAAAALDGSQAWLEPTRPAAPVPAGAEMAAQLAAAPGLWLSSSPAANGVKITAGSYWAQGGADGKISVGTAPGGTPTAVWQAHAAAVMGLALTPDGLVLLSAGYDGTLCRWDAATGKALGRL